MGTRLQFHQKLIDCGTTNVYFQPPESLRMKYPAIIYSRSNILDTPADNLAYFRRVAYRVIVVDEDPDSALVEAVANLPHSRYISHYSSEGLNHDVFEIYF